MNMKLINSILQIFFPIEGIGQYCVLYSAATGLFLLHLERRSHAAIRLAVGIVMLLLYNYIGNQFFATVQCRSDWNILWYAGTFFIGMVLGKCICAISWMEAFYCAANGLFTEHLASSLFICFFSINEQLSWQGLLHYGIYLITYVLVYYMVARRLHDGGHYTVNYMTVLISSSAGIAITTFLSAQIKVTIDPSGMFRIANEKFSALLRLSQIYAICFCVLMLAIQLLYHKDMVAQKRATVIQALWEQRKAQYQLSKENIELINRKCHDMKHQIAALMRMETNGVRRESFVKEVQDMIEIYDTDVDTGNEALNTILMQYNLYCRMHNIQWTGMADGTVLSFIDELDIYTLLGNAFDNAIESVEQVDHANGRIIQFQIGRRDHFIVIHLENSFSGELLLKNGFPVTSKTDKENHGFGIRSIVSIAEKYHGSASVKAADGIFVLNIVIPLSEKQDRQFAQMNPSK